MNSTLPNIWLIEDNPADAVIIEEMLEGFCRLTAFVRVSDALKDMSTNGVTCLLLDLSLPDSSGLEGLKAVRDVNPYIPVVILTGSNDMTLALEAIHFGAEDFLIKNHLTENMLRKTISFAIERSRMKREIIIANEELAQSKRNVEDLTYALTHDIRSPLSNVRICMNLLGQEKTDNPEIEKLLEVMGKSVSQIHTTIEGFNEVLQVRDRTSELREWIDVVAVWKDLKKYYTDHLYDIDVVFNENLDTSQLFFVPFVLRSILQNLLSNSIKYRKQDVKLHITLDMKKEEEGTLLTFSDNGLGIDMQKVGDSLFEPFSRFHTDLQVEGTGVGLYIIKAMIEVNGGSVKVTSEVNKGTTFHVFFNESNAQRRPKRGQA